MSARPKNPASQMPLIPAVFDASTFPLPARQPYEGAATRKQKKMIYDLGIKDEPFIDSLGRTQASQLIDRLLGATKKNDSRVIGKSRLWVGAPLFIIGILLVSWSRGMATAGTFYMLSVGFCFVVGGLLLFTALPHLLRSIFSSAPDAKDKKG